MDVTCEMKQYRERRQDRRSPVLSEDAPEKEDIYVQESLAATRFLLPASNLLAASRSNLLHLALRSALEVGEPNTNQANNRWASNGPTHRRRRLHSVMAPVACHWFCQPNYRASLKKSKETSAASWSRDLAIQKITYTGRLPIFFFSFSLHSLVLICLTHVLRNLFLGRSQIQDRWHRIMRSWATRRDGTAITVYGAMTSRTARNIWFSPYFRYVNQLAVFDVGSKLRKSVLPYRCAWYNVNMHSL